MKHTAALFVGTLAWVATVALASFGPRFLWDGNPALSWAAVALNVLAGAAWIVVHVRYLRAVGELQRKVLLEAMAIALGVGLVAGLAGVVARGAELITVDSDADIAIVTVIMAVVYSVATLAGNLRYR